MEQAKEEKKSTTKRIADFLIKVFAWVPLASLGALGTTYQSIQDILKTDYSYEIMKVVAQIKQESERLEIVDMPESKKQDPFVLKIRSLQSKILTARIQLSSINTHSSDSNNRAIDSIFYYSEIRKIEKLYDETIMINNEMEEIVKLYPRCSDFFILKEYKKMYTNANKDFGKFLGSITKSTDDIIEKGENLLCDKRLLMFLNSKDNEFLFIFGFLNTLQIDFKHNKM